MFRGYHQTQPECGQITQFNLMKYQLNMKSFVIFFGIMVAVAAGEQTIVKMPQEIADKVRKFATPCADENHLDHGVILQLPAGSVPDDEPGRRFLYCFTRATGYVAEDGHMVVDKLAEILQGHPLQDQFKDALNQCNQVTKENPLATVMAMHKCFAERPPVRLVF